MSSSPRLLAIPAPSLFPYVLGLSVSISFSVLCPCFSVLKALLPSLGLFYVHYLFSRPSLLSLPPNKPPLYQICCTVWFLRGTPRHGPTRYPTAIILHSYDLQWLSFFTYLRYLCDIWMKALLRWEAPLAHKLFDPLSIRPQALWTKVYRGILAQHTDDASPSLRADGAFLPDNWQSSTLPQNPPDPTMVPFCSSLVGKTSFSSMETS